MKRLILLALPLAISVLAAGAYGRDAANSTASSRAPRNIGAELQYERGMAKHIHEELNLYGSNRRVREQIRQVDTRIFRVNDELKSHNYDPNRLHAQAARIDDTLHTIDYELRDLIAHEPATLTGGRDSLVH
jgi:hypothetical protein